jgi:hypothetical protein
MKGTRTRDLNVQVVAGSNHLQSLERNVNILHKFQKPDSVQRTALLGYYVAGSCNFLPTLWDKLSVPSSRIKTPKSLKSHEVYSTADMWWILKSFDLISRITRTPKDNISFMLYIRRVSFRLFDWILWSKVNIINERVLINSFSGGHRSASARWIERFGHCGTVELRRNTLTILLIFWRGTI